MIYHDTVMYGYGFRLHYDAFLSVGLPHHLWGAFFVFMRSKRFIPGYSSEFVSRLNPEH